MNLEQWIKQESNAFEGDDRPGWKIYDSCSNNIANNEYVSVYDRRSTIRHHIACSGRCERCRWGSPCRLPTSEYSVTIIDNPPETSKRIIKQEEVAVAAKLYEFWSSFIREVFIISKFDGQVLLTQEQAYRLLDLATKGFSEMTDYEKSDWMYQAQQIIEIIK